MGDDGSAAGDGGSDCSTAAAAAVAVAPAAGTAGSDWMVAAVGSASGAILSGALIPSSTHSRSFISGCTR